jgi:RNA-directed DNA polymerase
VGDAVADRLAQVGLELHPDKTPIVSCKDADRMGSYERSKFTFLGYEFRPGWPGTGTASSSCRSGPRSARTRCRRWAPRSACGIWPGAVTVPGRPCPDVQQHRAGWINYSGRFDKSWLLSFLRRLNNHLVRWVCWKYRQRLRNRERGAMAWLAEIARRSPRLFAHWRLGAGPDGWAMGAG